MAHGARQAIEAAKNADVSLPFGGVPMGVKELDKVAGWPDTEASKVFEGRVGTYDNTMIDRLVGAGAALVGEGPAGQGASAARPAQKCAKHMRIYLHEL